MFKIDAKGHDITVYYPNGDIRAVRKDNIGVLTYSSSDNLACIKTKSGAGHHDFCVHIDQGNLAKFLMNNEVEYKSNNK